MKEERIAIVYERRFLDATFAFDYSPWVARELG